jgi:hypothetical protein
MLARHGVGYHTAGALLCAAGDNSERLDTEGSYAALCGSSPVEISSGKTKRHRLNRAGDRHANAALWTIVMVRIRSKHPPTIDYIDRRTSEGPQNEQRSAAANATSPARSTTTSEPSNPLAVQRPPNRKSPLDPKRRIRYGASIRTVFLAMSFGKGCSLKNHENNKPW